jgi:hypothetical protein
VCEGLVVVGWVEREFSDELPVEIDHADLLVGDDELDCAAFVGYSEADLWSFGLPPLSDDTLSL